MSIRAEKETIDLRRINRRDGLVVTRQRGKSSGFSGFQRTISRRLALMKTPARLAIINAIISLRYCKPPGGSAKIDVVFLPLFFSTMKERLHVICTNEYLRVIYTASKLNNCCVLRMKCQSEHDDQYDYRHRSNGETNFIAENAFK